MKTLKKVVLYLFLTSVIAVIVVVATTTLVVTHLDNTSITNTGKSDSGFCTTSALHK